MSEYDKDNGIYITQHAVEQFIKRSGSKRKPESIPKKLQHMHSRAREIIRTDATLSILNNGCVEAKYYLYKSWIMVVVDGKMTTCYLQPKGNLFIPVPQSA